MFEIGRSPVAPVVLLLVYAALMCAGLYLSRGVGAAGPPCAFRSLTGLPCPACGSTRVIVHAASGELGQAFLQNPLMFVLLTVGLPVMVRRYFMPRSRPAAQSGRCTILYSVMLLLAVIANWLYVAAYMG